MLLMDHETVFQIFNQSFGILLTPQIVVVRVCWAGWTMALRDDARNDVCPKATNEFEHGM